MEQDSGAEKLHSETVDKNESKRKVGPNFSPESKMFPNSLPSEASHSSLDLFSRIRSPPLINYEASFEQKVRPLYAHTGPTLEIEVTGDRTNFIDLQILYLEVKYRITQANGNDLRYDATAALNSDLPCFVNHTLHSLFADCNVTAEGVQIASSNGN